MRGRRFIRKPYEASELLARIHYILVNREMRTGDSMQWGAEIYLSGKRYFITAERQQILDLLFSTFMDAVQINGELELKQRELMQLAGQLKEKADDLVTANKELERRGTNWNGNRGQEPFFASMSHDLRTPMNAIIGFRIFWPRDGRSTQRQTKRFVQHVGTEAGFCCNSSTIFWICRSSSRASWS